MKIKCNFIVSALIICLTSLASIANENFAVNSIHENSFFIELPNESYSKIQVSIKDMDGFTLYDETVTQDYLDTKKFNLEELPSGSYILMVTYDLQTKIQTIKKDHKSLKINDADLLTIFQPTFHQHSDYVDINMLCLFDLEVSIMIKDADGNILFNELAESDGSIHKRFNLSMLNEGLYTFTLTINNDIIYDELVDWAPNTTAFNDLN